MGNGESGKRVGRCLFIAVLCAGTLSGANSVAPLADAAEVGRPEHVRGLLDDGLDPNGSQPDGMTALHWAAYREDFGIAELLIKSGADPDAQNRYGVTPLYLACVNGNGAMVELLVTAGADPNGVQRGGETALMTAARTGKVDAVRVLLDHGAEVGTRDGIAGQTALMWAAAEGHTGVIRLLLESGANVDARLASGFTPLLFAVREGRIEAMEALLEAGADANDWIRPPASTLSQARGYRGAPPYGASALLIAVENAHFELATRLLDAGADANAAKTGYTTLHAMARVRNPGVGDNDPPPDGSGSMTSIEFVQEIARRGADVNARMTKNVNLTNTRISKMGATPFFLAAHTADVELMRALAELGADTLLGNDDDTTPLMAAAGVGTRSPGEDAGTEGEVLEAINLAMELGADINAVDDKGETAMHGAAYKNLPRAVEHLASLGADIGIWNRPNRFGWTPLAIATGYRFGNFKPSEVTVAALRRVMLSAGVLPPETVQAETQQIY